MKKWTVLGYGIKTAMCVQEKSAAENARILYPPSTLVIVSPHRSMASAWPLLRPGPGSNVSKLGGACVSEKEIPFPCRSIWGDGFSCTELQARTVFCRERGKEKKGRHWKWSSPRLQAALFCERMYGTHLFFQRKSSTTKYLYLYRAIFFSLTNWVVM